MARGKEKAELVGEAAKQKVTAHGGPGGDESNASQDEQSICIVNNHL
jgi:hypothetical protein